MNKNFNFDNLNLLTKKCLYISDNKAILRNKKLYCISDLINNESYKNLYVTEDIKEAKDHNDYSEIYIDLGVIMFYIGYTMDGYTDVQKVAYRLEHIIKTTLDDFKSNIIERANSNQFINVAEIKLMELSGEDISPLVTARESFLQAREERYAQELIEKELKDQQFLLEKKSELDIIIIAAENAICNNQEVKNVDVRVYTEAYTYGYTETSLILYLMKKYEIKVPLKTQGWINKALAQISYDDDKYNYSYYTSSANSTVFRDYLQQLVLAIKLVHRVTAA